MVDNPLTPLPAPQPTKLDRLLAWPGFLAALVFLCCLGGAIHVQNAVDLDGLHPYVLACLIGLASVYLFFPLEAVLHGVSTGRFWWRNLWCCVFPPLRLCARDHALGTAVWLPGMGWCHADLPLVKRLERAFNGPMILIALMVLPLMAIEFRWSDELKANPTLRLCVDIGTSLIWLAFSAEFLVMIVVVERKLSYARKHWVDLAIICLPMAAFMRVLRLSQLIRLKQLTRVSRVYRIRGLVMRGYRAVLALDTVQRFVRIRPERRLRGLEQLLQEKERETAELQAEIQSLKLQLAEEANSLKQAQSPAHPSTETPTPAPATADP